jgi:hypothetical protein
MAGKYLIIIFEMNQNNGQGEPALPNCADIIRPLPFWTRVVYFGLIISWLFDFITRFPSEYLACSVQKIFEYDMFWTVLTSAFYVDSLFFLTIIIYNFNTFLPKLVFVYLSRNKGHPLLSFCSPFLETIS